MLLFMFAAFGAEELIWAGVDLSQVRLVGEVAIPAVPPKKKKEGLPAVGWSADSVTRAAREWNQKIERAGMETTDAKFRIRPVAQTSHLVNVHESMDTQVILETRKSSDPFLTRADIVLQVASYPRNPLGIAFTFIADQLNTFDGQGCYWATFYDTGTGVVHETTYRCARTAFVGRDPVPFWYGSLKRVLAGLPERKLPDRRVRLHLTDNEKREALARDPAAAEVFASVNEDAEQLVEDAKEDRQRKADERAMLWGGAGFVTIRTTQQGLTLLRQNNIAFQPVSSANVVVGVGTGAVQQEAECVTSYGKTACGYDCKTAYGDVRCAGSPGGKCDVSYGEITCSN